MSFVLGTKDEVLTLSADYTQFFALAHRHRVLGTPRHEKPHRQKIQHGFRRNVINFKQTKGELEIIDGSRVCFRRLKTSKVTWPKRSTEDQWFKASLSIIFQDNTRTIKLAENKKLSSEKRPRHFDISMFHVTVFISRKEVTIQCCPTGKILADYFGKPLIGKIFCMMRSNVMNVHPGNSI